MFLTFRAQIEKKNQNENTKNGDNKQSVELNDGKIKNFGFFNKFKGQRKKTKDFSIQVAGKDHKCNKVLNMQKDPKER